MTTVRAHGSLVPFTLPLEIDDHLGVSKYKLNLKFNVHVETMNVKQEMYNMERYWRKY